MAGVTTRSAHPAALWPGVNKFFGKTYKEFPKEYMQVFDMEKSNKHYEEDVESTGFGLAPIKPEGAAIQYDADQQGYTQRYTHVTYGLGYIVTEEEIEDNLYYGKSKMRARNLAFSMRQTKEEVHASLFNNGFTTSIGGDGVAMLSDSHPVLAGQQSNILAVPADLSEASIEQLLIQIKDMRNSRGLKISQKGMKLIVSDENCFNAERIINTNLRVGTDLNDLNAIKSMGMLPNGICNWTYLSDPDAWFIKTDVMEGLKTFQRRPMKFTQDNDFDTSNAKAKCTERYERGISDWRGIYGSMGA